MVGTGGRYDMVNPRFIGYTTALVVVAKFLLGWSDAAPLFFLGDSATYLSAAIEGFRPIDRSFTYPRLIGWLAVAPGSLTVLLATQMAAGAATSMLLGFILYRYGGVRPGFAIAASLALALDPLIVVHERLVLAESFTLLAYAGVLTLGLAYLAKPRFTLIAAACALGLGLLSLRTVYLPLMLAFPVVLVAVAGAFPAAPRGVRPRPRVLLGHLAGALLVTALLHYAYRQDMGRHFGGHPGYQHMDGLIVLGSWSPCVDPVDARDPRFAAAIVRQRVHPAWPSDQRAHRERQLWLTNGLVEELVREVYAGDRVGANAAAKQVVRNTLVRDPSGIAWLGMLNARDYLRPAHLEGRIVIEQGSDRPLDEAFQRVLRDRFDVDGTGYHLVLNPARSYHRLAWPWYLVLALSPLLNLATVFLVPREQRPAALLLAVCAILLMAVTLLTAPDAVVRYLHPFTFTAWAAIALLAGAALPRRGRSA